MRVLSTLFFVALMFSALAARAGGSPTPQQLEELSHAECVYRDGSVERAKLADPDGMFSDVGPDGPIQFQTRVPYMLICKRYLLKLRKGGFRQENCHPGSGCFKDKPRRAEACDGDVPEIRLPPGSSVKIKKTGCWHIARRPVAH